MGEMTAQQYIDALIARNPAIGRPDDETVTLTARGLRAIIRQAHEKGVEHGREVSEKFHDVFSQITKGKYGR